MVRFKLSRDQAREIEEKFFPYMMLAEKMKLRDARMHEYEFFITKMKISLLHDIIITFKRKLLTDQKKFLFKFPDHHGICLYQLLIKQPVDSTRVYDVWLRQNLMNVLHKQLLEYHDEEIEIKKNPGEEKATSSAEYV